MSEERVHIHSIDKRTGSEVEITAEVHASFFLVCRKKALDSLAQTVTVPGFRKGHVPEQVLIGAVGHMKILEEAAEIALRDVIPAILASEKLRPIGQPEVAITKIAQGNPLEFKMKVFVLPDIVLPDYRKLSAEVREKNGMPSEMSVSEKEVEDVAQEVAHLRADHSHQGHSDTKSAVPHHAPLTDDLARELGNFRDLAHFKEVVRESLVEEKRRRSHEKLRLQLLHKISSSTSFEVPKILIEHELERMLARLTHDLEGAGTTVEKYLVDSKKSLDEMKREWRKDAERQARYELLLTRIAEDEKLAPEKSEIESLAHRLLADAKAHKQEVDHSRAHAYAERLLTNEMVFRLLENSLTNKPESSLDEKKRPS